jgi:glutamine amidotransferase
VVLDYGSGNLRSAERALARVGAEVTVTSDSTLAMEADGLILPGVGAFAACMTGIEAVDGSQLIRKRVAAQRPVLGICVGMQVLFTDGEEHGVNTRGIGAWPGRVRRLDADVLPHMGWNVLEPAPQSLLFKGLDREMRYYFVHSYAATCAPGHVSWAQHGERFVAAVEDGALSGLQFHPEKSGDAGAHILMNWLETLS